MGCARTILPILVAEAAAAGSLRAQRVEFDIPYRAHATVDQRMDLYAPAAARRAPVVLFIHGGSLDEAGDRRNAPMYAPVCPGLTSRGMLCVTMDYRLAPSHRWPAMPQDVAAAVRWLKDSIAARGGDPERIFLVGHSSGCHLAALVALDTIYLAEQGLHTAALAGVVAMGCTLAPWDTAGRAVTRMELEQAFAGDEAERRAYGSLTWRLRANPSRWVGAQAPPFLVLVAESERYTPAILEQGARFVRRLREQGRSADLRILSGRRHVTTTTGFADSADPVANLVAEFVRDPEAVTAPVSCPGAAAGEPVRDPERAWMFGPFEKPGPVNPVITPQRTSTFRSPMNDSTVQWEEYATFNPAAVTKNGKVYVLYRAEDATGEAKIGHHTSRIGLAESRDGLHFTRRRAPVLYPDRDAQARLEWPGGVEDPRIVETEDGTYVLTYTQWNRVIPRLAIATSRDLISWTKHGPAFATSESGRYWNLESKSGAILSRVQGDRVIATKVNGKYWMYFNVPDILLATSDNLIEWTPLEDADGKLVKVLSPRPGYFDSWLVEAGPPALITERGILVLYNAGNSAQYGDPSVPPRTYTGGQALYDLHNPLRLIARSDAPFIRPTEDYERSGQYREGTTFVEGLVPFEGRWYLYYGMADSRVGVAVWDPRRSTSDR